MNHEMKSALFALVWIGLAGVLVFAAARGAIYLDHLSAAYTR